MELPRQDYQLQIALLPATYFLALSIIRENGLCELRSTLANNPGNAPLLESLELKSLL